MKALLMYQDRDFDPQASLATNAGALTQDLELDTLFQAMSAGDEFLFGVARTAVLRSIVEPDTIQYRQHILADCLEHPKTVRDMYGLAVEAVEHERKVWGWMSARYPEGTLHRSIEVLKLFMESLKRLRGIALEQSDGFHSEGFRRFFAMIASELDDEYVGLVEDHLALLEFRNGLLMSAELGNGNRGVNYILRRPSEVKRSWPERLQGWLEQVTGKNNSSYVYEIADRDEAGFRALSDLRTQGIAHVAAALAQSTDHILSFFNMLRTELGFYVGCLNLEDLLIRKGEPICFPEPLPAESPMLSGRALYDVCLSLKMDARVVGNEVAGDGKLLVMITGANRGGKSTFLRSLGLAQLIMQCGMFVPAQQFRANVCRGLFTHFKREEDATMKSGKLDEELIRMSAIVDRLSANSIVLFNESFGSTNEREGSEIARQIVRGLLEAGTKVYYVTHMFDLAHGFYRERMDAAQFLRAERLSDGRRTFRLVEREPQPTSYGRDVYERIFESAPESAPDAAVHP
jgi:DNA mismatch repair ATPase MutS